MPFSRAGLGDCSNSIAGDLPTSWTGTRISLAEGPRTEPTFVEEVLGSRIRTWPRRSSGVFLGHTLPPTRPRNGEGWFD